MQLLELFETLAGEDYVGAAMVALIKKVNKSISRLHNENYSVTLSPEDAVEDKICCLSGDMAVCDHAHLSYPIFREGVTFGGWHINLVM
jgi:hypothetical protein